MIQVHKDELGNITGHFDLERKQWVPPPPTDMEAEVLDEEAPPAADGDDAGEPEEEPEPAPEPAPKKRRR